MQYDKKSIGERCKAAGINRSTFYARLRRGWTEEQALGAPVAPRRFCSDDGIGERLAVAGISRSTYYGRRNLGWTEEQALRPVSIGEGKPSS
jgi:predicted DNA-binding transcriptional regulator AlpA